jgi:hypothetical protein
MVWSQHSAGHWRLSIFSRFGMYYDESQGHPGVYATSFSWITHLTESHPLWPGHAALDGLG